MLYTSTGHPACTGTTSFGVKATGECQPKQPNCLGGEWFDSLSAMCAEGHSCCVAHENKSLVAPPQKTPPPPQIECGGLDAKSFREVKGVCRTAKACAAAGGRVDAQLSRPCDENSSPDQDLQCCLPGFNPFVVLSSSPPTPSPPQIECGGLDAKTFREVKGVCRTAKACAAAGGRVDAQLSRPCDENSSPDQDLQCCLAGFNPSVVLPSKEDAGPGIAPGDKCEGAIKIHTSLFKFKPGYGRGVCRFIAGTSSPRRCPDAGAKLLGKLGCAEGFECCGAHYDDKNSRTELDDDASLVEGGEAGLSTTVIAVIVAVVVVVLLVCIAAIACLMHRRRNSAVDRASATFGDSYGGSFRKAAASASSRRHMSRSGSRGHTSRRSTRQTQLARARSGLAMSPQAFVAPVYHQYQPMTRM